MRHSAPLRFPTARRARLIEFLFQTSRDMLVIIDLGSPPHQVGSFLDVNDVACEKLGYNRAELLQLASDTLVTKETVNRLQAKLATEGAALEECVLIGKDTKRIYTELNIHLLHYGRKLVALGIGRDIGDRWNLESAWKHLLSELEDRINRRTTELMEINRELQLEIIERVRAEQTLAEKEQQLRLITDNMLDIVMQIDLEGRMKYVSPSCKTMLGYEPSELLAKVMLPYIHEDDRPSVLAAYQQVLTSSAPVVAECRVKHVHGRWIWIEWIGKRVYDTNGQLLGMVAIRDITNRKRMEQQLKFQAVRDPITGLHNRNYFELEMARMIDIKLHPVGLIMCDLDGLKYVNDTLGHDSGDNLLATVADIINACFPGEEIIARIGGDEFAIILPKIDEIRLAQGRNRIRAGIAAYNSGGPKIPLSVSIGAAITGGSITIAGLFKEADNSMYREKLHSQRSSRSSVVQALKKALEARDFVTEGHANRLQDLSVHLAKRCGFPDYKLTDLRLFAEFHDIGKVGIPDRILFKPATLSAEEAVIMRGHCEIGHRIAVSSPDLEPIADWILKHHEWWNGKGYPLGLSGRLIPLECRILSIVDAYDAMTNDRPYRQAVAQSEALAEIKRYAGIQFDPELVERFVGMVKSVVPSA